MNDEWIENFMFLVKEYACCDDSKLSKDAIELKKAVIDAVNEVSNV